jgi:hypothetical protein
MAAAGLTEPRWRLGAVVSPWRRGAPRGAASRWEAAANPWPGACMVLAYWKFESISLQRNQAVPLKSLVDPPPCPECRANPRLLCRGTRSSNPSPSRRELDELSVPKRRSPISKSATTRLTAPAYWKFESISLQRRVRCELVPTATGGRAGSLARAKLNSEWQTIRDAVAP